jgi:hypothetical protein
MTEIKNKGLFKIKEIEQEISGFISYNEKNKSKITLELFGTIDPVKIRIIKEILKIECITGIIEGNKKVTIFDAYVEKHSFTSSEENPLTLELRMFCSYLIVGAFYENKNQFNVKSIKLKFNNLDDWLQKSGFKISDSKNLCPTIKYKHPRSWNYKIPYIDKKISFFFGLNGITHTNPQLEINLKQESTLLFSPITNEEFNYFEFIETKNKILNLLSLLIGKNIFLSSTEAEIKTNTPPNSKNCQVYFNQSFWQESKRMHWWDIGIPFDSINRSLSKIIKKWLDSYETLDFILDMFMGTIYNNKLFINQIFLNRVQCIEAYTRINYNLLERSENKFDKRLKKIRKSIKNKKIEEWFNGKMKYANEKNLKERLVFIFNKNKFFLEPYIQNIQDFSSKVTSTRNYNTHFDPNLKEKSIPFEEMHTYNLKLKLMMEVILFKDLGIKKELIKKHLEKNYPLHQILSLETS